MSLRAEIAIIDDDENVVGIVKVPLFKSDQRTFDRGPFAENLVTDPDTGEVYKFTFQADVVGRIAPKHKSDDVTFPKVGDVVRIIDYHAAHAFSKGALVEVDKVFEDDGIVATGAGKYGETITQFVSRDDYILE